MQEMHVENDVEINLHLICVYHMQAWINSNGG